MTKINLCAIRNNNIYEKRIKHIVWLVINTCSMKLIAVIFWPVLCGRSSCYIAALWALFHILQMRREYNSLPRNQNTKCYCEKAQLGAHAMTATRTGSYFAQNEESTGQKHKHRLVQWPSACNQTAPLTHKPHCLLLSLPQSFTIHGSQPSTRSLFSFALYSHMKNKYNLV